MVMPASCDDALVARGPLSLSLSTFLVFRVLRCRPQPLECAEPFTLSGHTAFSAPRTKTDKEVNKQQPVAILVQGSRSACHDEHEGSLCFASPCFALLPCALTCHSLLCFAVRCSALLCCASLCLALLCLALRCLALPSFAFLCFALLCCSLLCVALLCVDLLCFALR